MKMAHAPFAAALAAALVAAAAGAALRGSGGDIARPEAASSPPAAAPAAPATAQQQQQKPRAKLDVGFADFDDNVTNALASIIETGMEGEAWTEQRRKTLAKNATDSLHQALQDALKPLKLSIGKTWVALPEDAQKEAYVSQIRSGFASTLDRSKDSILSHVKIGLHRAGMAHMASTSGAASSAAASEEDLVAKAEQVLLGGVLSEHCYDEHDLKHAKTAAKGKNASAAPAKESKFCIPSVVEALAKRLNDTQGLVGMTMRFEAHALDLAQQHARAKPRQLPQQ